MVAALLLLFFEESVFVQRTLFRYRHGLVEAVEDGIGLSFRHLRSDEAYKRHNDETEYHRDSTGVNRGGNVTEDHVGYGDTYTNCKACPDRGAGDFLGVQAVHERS